MLTASSLKNLEVSASLSSPSSTMIACEKPLESAHPQKAHETNEEYVNALTCSSFGTDPSSCERLSRLLRSENFNTKLDQSGHSRMLVFMIGAQKVSKGMDSCPSCTTT